MVRWSRYALTACGRVQGHRIGLSPQIFHLVDNVAPGVGRSPSLHYAATQYRTIDLAPSAIDPHERIVQSTSPERALMEALGVEAIRSGSKRALRARVYFQHPGQPLSMVRLYAKVDKGSLSESRAEEAKKPH